MPKKETDPDRKTNQEKTFLPAKTELFMKQIGIPDAFFVHTENDSPAGQSVLPDGTKVLIRQLTDAVESREKGKWKRIPEEIWLATMLCFPRFISEYRRSYGRDGFDRGSWTVRQSGCRLFRIGELEYELFEEDRVRAVSLHIPSDARLEPSTLNDSIRQVRDFLSAYYPDWQALPMICESWLLSPKLRDMLPSESRIIRFQSAFDLVKTNPEDTSAIEWVFYVAEGQRASMKTEDLPETTSLQRKMKALLLQGEKPGSALGILARSFE